MACSIVDECSMFHNRLPVHRDRVFHVAVDTTAKACACGCQTVLCASTFHSAPVTLPQRADACATRTLIRAGWRGESVGLLNSACCEKSSMISLVCVGQPWTERFAAARPIQSASVLSESAAWETRVEPKRSCDPLGWGVCVGPCISCRDASRVPGSTRAACARRDRRTLARPVLLFVSPQPSSSGVAPQMQANRCVVEPYLSPLLRMPIQRRSEVRGYICVGRMAIARPLPLIGRCPRRFDPIPGRFSRRRSACRAVQDLRAASSRPSRMTVIR